MPLFEILVDLGMQAGVKLLPAISMTLLIKVVLVGGQHLFAFPFHVRDKVPKPPLHFLRGFRRLIDISDTARHMPF